MDIQGKNVVITGASSGIGYELLERLLRYNCKIVAVSRNISKSEIQNENLFKFDCDLSNSENIDKVFAFALEKLGNIDIYIANAGFAFYEKLGKPDWEHINKIFSINVYSAIYAAQKIKEISKDRPFNFVITASAQSFVSIPGYSLYSGTKAALRGFADAYRYELLKGQNIQVAYPIATATKFFEAAGDIPKAWPVQSTTTVGKRIIAGIKNDKKHIYPSKIFFVFKYIANIIPPFIGIYNITSNKAFRDWQKKKQLDN